MRIKVNDCHLEDFWGGPNATNTAAYMTECMPLYSRIEQDPDAMKRPVMTPEVIAHFSQPGGENWTFDFREQLSSIGCPTLVTAGDIDPITPIEAVQELADHIPEAVLQMEIFPECGHGVHRDAARAFDVMKKFIED